jgi:prolipoprotein diacylglyceryltransferase
MILVFGMRFLIEFLKEPQEGFEKSMILNLGQLLSIPLIIAGAILVWLATKNSNKVKRIIDS